MFSKSLYRTFCLAILTCLILGMLTGCFNKKEQNGIAEDFATKDTVATLSTADTESVKSDAPVKVGFVTGVKLRVRSGPSADYEKIGELDTGTKVSFTEFREASDGTWGKMELGWIFMDHVYIPGTVTNRHGFVVVKQNGVSIYDAILQPRNAVKKLAIGDRYEILHYITFDGDERWGYTRQGWIDLRQVYLEGEDGEKPGGGIVQDITPLNVRTGPGTGYEIIGKLENGTRVAVKEQITCNHDTWGYNGTGWIAMSRVVEDTSDYGALIGRWKCVYRSTTEGVDIYTGDAWTFYSDGKYVNTCHEGMYYYDENGKLLPVPNTGMGSQDFVGTYRLEGNKLYLTCTYIEWEENAALPIYETVTIQLENDNILRIGGTTYYKCEENESLESIIARYKI